VRNQSLICSVQEAFHHRSDAFFVELLPLTASFVVVVIVIKNAIKGERTVAAVDSKRVVIVVVVVGRRRRRRRKDFKAILLFVSLSSSGTTDYDSDVKVAP
jgi:hypothetical protein